MESFGRKFLYTDQQGSQAIWLATIDHVSSAAAASTICITNVELMSSRV